MEMEVPLADDIHHPLHLVLRVDVPLVAAIHAPYDDRACRAPQHGGNFRLTTSSVHIPSLYLVVIRVEYNPLLLLPHPCQSSAACCLLPMLTISFSCLELRFLLLPSTEIHAKVWILADPKQEAPLSSSHPSSAHPLKPAQSAWSVKRGTLSAKNSSVVGPIARSHGSWRRIRARPREPPCFKNPRWNTRFFSRRSSALYLSQVQ